MIQVVYEVQQAWPKDGAFKLSVPNLEAEIVISPALARRRAKGYLTAEVAMSFRPGEPVLVLGADKVWRMPICLHLRGFGQVGQLGTIDVDALSGKVIALSPNQVAAMQERADELAAHFTPAPTAAG
jgi:hypothetical protein